MACQWFMVILIQIVSRRWRPRRVRIGTCRLTHTHKIDSLASVKFLKTLQLCLIEKLPCFFVRRLGQTGSIEKLPRGIALSRRPRKNAAAPLPVGIIGEGARYGYQGRRR